MENQTQIFISYAREDYAVVRQLYDWLHAAGYRPWMDKYNLLPGQVWAQAIDKAIHESDLFIVCLSSHSVSQRGFIQREINFALSAWDQKAADDIYILPVRLEECEVPEIIRQFQWVDLFGANAQEGWVRLLKSLREMSSRIGIRKVALKALFNAIGQDLQKISNLQGLAKADELLKALPKDAKYAYETQQRINDIAIKAQDYQTRTTLVGQIAILEELRSEITAFLNVIGLITRSSDTNFQTIVTRWLDIVTSEETKARQQLDFTPIPNPFIVGNPVKKGDEEVFKGRRDIIVALEDNIINARQRPALLLYGRRRTGKSSTLLNLPRLMSSQFVPVFMDCQNAKLWASDEEFCYHLATAIFHELFQRNLHEGLRQPRLEEYEKYAFTRLDEFLDRVETLSRKINKQILLTFDEYERMELGITNAKISEAVLNQFRTIIQHRERIVVLVSGSHRFEELKAVNWSDYLINAKTLELSYLKPDEARALLTEPVPNLRYDEAVLDAILDVTHCQPFLLQAVASDLVNYLNGQKRQHATMDDLAIAVEKVLVTADGYFYNTWNDCSAAEQEALRTLVTGQDESLLPAELQAAVQSLRRKEVVEPKPEGYRLSVALFGRWIRKNQLAESLPEPQNEWPPANQTYELPTPYNSYGAAEILSKELQ